MNKIFFDLDGTLLDSKMRLYKLFCDLTNQDTMSFEEYWTLKKAKTDHSTILGKYLKYSENQIKIFQEKWLGLIEKEAYLKLDICFVFTEKILVQLSKTHLLYVVTARQDKQALMHQLDNLKLTSYFQDVLVTEAKSTKAELIKKYVHTIDSEDLLVGDTGMDILTAKELGCRSLAVLSGFRNKEILIGYEPDYIENDIQSIIKYV